MHSPQLRQVLRCGPGAAEVRVVDGLPGAWPGPPKKTPTGVGWNVSPAPISSATVFMTSSDGVIVGYSTTPSIRFAWS